MRAVHVQDLQTRLWYAVYVSVMLFWDVLGPVWKPMEKTCLCHLSEA